MTLSVFERCWEVGFSKLIAILPDERTRIGG
jgi:hypothetical protein